ncbi:MAG: ubiquitin-activating E1 FCCH domain-containing protein [Acidobacteriota bacterium]
MSHTTKRKVAFVGLLAVLVLIACFALKPDFAKDHADRDETYAAPQPSTSVNAAYTIQRPNIALTTERASSLYYKRLENTTGEIPSPVTVASAVYRPSSIQRSLLFASNRPSAPPAWVSSDTSPPPAIVAASVGTTLATCVMKTQIFDFAGRGLRGVRFFVRVHSGVVNNQFIQPVNFTAATDGEGKVRIPLVQGATVTISGTHPSFAAPVTLVVPAQAEYDLLNIGNLNLGTPPLSAPVGGIFYSDGVGAVVEETKLFWKADTDQLALGTGTPATSALFTMVSTTKGLLPPRMTTTERDAISTPDEGLTIYNTTTKAPEFYNGTSWGSAGGSGIATLNGLTGATQSFATGTTGSDFNISSAGSTHTFNIPTASATVRGLLSTADWTTFNNKQAALGFTAENSANKNATNGYAGLLSGKLTASQGQEVWAVTDLTDYTAASGVGSTAIKATFTALASGEAITWSGTNWVNSAVGSVTSVAFSTNASWLTVTGSPVTGSGTLTVNLTTGLSANQFLATPDGSTGTVGLRAIVAADLPTITVAKGGTGLTSVGSAFQVLGTNSTATAFTHLTIAAGANITVTPSGSTITIAAASAGAHTILDSTTHTDATTGTVVRGDIITGQGSGTPTWTRKAKGAQYQVLQADANDVVWGAVELAQAAATTGLLPVTRGGTGVDGSTVTNGQLLIGHDANNGFALGNLVAGSNITITNNAGSIQIDASGSLGAAWSNLTSPTGNLSLSHGANTTTFTWGNATGAGVDMAVLRDTASNTGTGHVLVVNTATSSAAKPVGFFAGGTANGVEMSTAGVLAVTGTGGLEADRLKGVDGNGYMARTAAGNFEGRTFIEGAGIDIADPDGVTNPSTFSLDLSTLVASQTMFDGSQASRTITFNLSAGDPVLTLGNGVFNISTGTLQQGGTAVVLQTRTLTGGTGIDTIGDLSADRTISINQAFAPTWTGVHTFTPAARSSGAAAFLKVTTPADTAQTADAEMRGIVFGGDASHAAVTRTGADGTTIATQREYLFVNPKYAFAGSTTITSAATVAIAAAPVADTNATITNSYALWVQGGVSRFDGNVLLNANNIVTNDATLSVQNLFDMQVAAASKLLLYRGKAISITSATNASPIVITTSTNHKLVTGDSVTISGVGGNTAANGTFTVTVTNSTTFSLDGSTGNGTYTSGGTFNTRTNDFIASGTSGHDVFRIVPDQYDGSKPSGYSRLVVGTELLIHNQRTSDTVAGTLVDMFEIRNGSEMFSSSGTGRLAIITGNTNLAGGAHVAMIETENGHDLFLAAGVSVMPSWFTGSFLPAIRILNGDAVSENPSLPHGSRGIVVYEPIKNDPNIASDASVPVISNPTAAYGAVDLKARVKATSSNAQDIFGLRGYADTTTDSSANLTGQIAGVWGKTRFQGSGGTMSKAASVFADVPIVATGRTLTEWAGLKVVATGSVSGTITTASGLLIESVTAGATNWGINQTGTQANKFGGQIQVASGSAGTPSLSFNAENNSGVYRIGTSNIGFVLTGNGVWRYDGTGIHIVQSLLFEGSFGGGSDIRLQRAAASVLKIGDNSTGGSALQLFQKVTTPANPGSSNEGNIYIKSNKLIIQWNDAGTVRYKYLDLTGTGVTWVHTTTAP